jgi:hypothetical protein
MDSVTAAVIAEDHREEVVRLALEQHRTARIAATRSRESERPFGRLGAPISGLRGWWLRGAL